MYISNIKPFLVVNYIKYKKQQKKQTKVEQKILGKAPERQCAHNTSACVRSKLSVHFVYTKCTLGVHNTSACVRSKLSVHFVSLTHCCDCRRKSLSGQWKTNMGQSILEEIPVNDKYRSWIDAVCKREWEEPYKPK